MGRYIAPYLYCVNKIPEPDEELSQYLKRACEKLEAGQDWDLISWTSDIGQAQVNAIARRIGKLSNINLSDFPRLPKTFPDYDAIGTSKEVCTQISSHW